LEVDFIDGEGEAEGAGCTDKGALGLALLRRFQVPGRVDVPDF
jgi:hypothetical protein